MLAGTTVIIQPKRVEETGHNDIQYAPPLDIPLVKVIGNDSESCLYLPHRFAASTLAPKKPHRLSVGFMVIAADHCQQSGLTTAIRAFDQYVVTSLHGPVEILQQYPFTICQGYTAEFDQRYLAVDWWRLAPRTRFRQGHA